MKIRTVLLQLLATFLLCSSAIAEQPAKSAIDAALDQLLAVRTFPQVAISPDGAHVAWMESLNGADGTLTGNTAIFVADAAGQTRPRRITAASDGDAAESKIAWSPDSRQLAFVSNASGRPQLYVADVTRPSQPHRLTDVSGVLDEPRWSPDGTRLAFLLIENAPREAGPLAAMEPQTGEIEEHPFEQRIAVVDLDTKN